MPGPEMVVRYYFGSLVADGRLHQLKQSASLTAADPQTDRKTAACPQLT